jgi:hypothetical protein
MNEEMRTRRGLLVLGLSALLALSCSHGILEDIKGDVEKAKLGGKPVINVFQLETPSPTNNRTVSFQLAGSAIASGWYVGEASSAPTADSSQWVSATPSQYTLSAGDGEKTVSAWAKSSSGELSEPKTISIVLDQTQPVVDAFVLTSATPTAIALIEFTLAGSDANGITRWLINESAASPSVNDASWVTTKPAGYTVSAGSGTKTVYAWARDGAGNVSSSKSIALTYNDPGRTPVILSFARTSASPTNAVLVTFTLTGNVDATHWIVNESATAPSAGDLGWQSSPPSDYTLTGSDGPRTLYAWAKNDFDVVSASLSISVVLDRAKPSITPPTRTSPADSDSRVVTFVPLTGIDANGITAWFLKENSSTPSLGDSGWVSSAPSSFTVSTSYSPYTISIWARDAAGNISDPATISMTLWPTPAATLQGGTERVGHEPIQLRFNASMNTGSVTVTGDLSACSKQWTTTTLSNDTLTLTPTTLWPSGSGKTLTIDGSSAQSIAMATFNAGFTVFYRIYVNDTNGGNDADPSAGSSMIPFATPGAALGLASSRYRPANPVELWVAQGTYTSTTGVVDAGAAADGVQILGGYQDGNWSVRLPQTYVSTLSDTATTGGIGGLALANRTVRFGSGMTSATILDGFTINGGASATSGSYCAAILCEGASPIIRNCTITGGISPASTSVGLLAISSSAPDVSTCMISGGTGTSYSIGFYGDSSSPHIHGNTITSGNNTSYSRTIYANAGSPLITGNSIRAGTTGLREGAGVYLDGGSTARIYNNTISGGKGGYLTTFTANGIYIRASAADVRNNTIDAGAVNDTLANPHPRGITLRDTSPSNLPTVENNIIFVRDTTNGGFGIFEYNASSDPSDVKNNDIFDCLDALYRDETGTNITAIADVNALVDTTSSGNVSVDPQFANRNGYDWHLSSTTSASTGGLVLSGISGFPESAGIKIDKDGVARTPSSGATGWSMGAFEHD